ncbi:MAG: cysteine--tRNA ligase [Alphaproteobacteria bacterium]|nr:cysteine--tRNA ligase [Alphaproteobacteria bacterium]
MQIRLYNTMTRKVEDFKSITPNHVGIYNCGPTVYWDQHLGNMRTFFNSDMMKRMFLANGYTVNHVMNFTDVGHLTSDEDTGEDKMEKGAARENLSVWDVANKYIKSCLGDMDLLNIMRPTHTPRATDHIKEQIELIQKLEKLGYTYEIPNDGIYYDTSKLPDYGKLGGQNLSELRGGARIENNNKRNITDFALWKFSPKDVKRQMEWDSPWGVGFPGWHLECSAMSMKYLGDHFDIHSGGQEHIKVHHTNEIAQSEPIVGAPWVHYWVHWAWLMLREGKMAKSSGSFFTVRGLIDKGYDPMAFRYLLLTGHYRQPMEFSFESLDAAAAGYKNMVRKVADLMAVDDKAPVNQDLYNEWHDKILTPISDNLKTSETLAAVQDLLKSADINPATKLSLVNFIDDLLGLQLMDRANKLRAAESETAPADVQKLADARADAKKNRDFATADELRAKIDAAGWRVMDIPGGFKLVKKG